METHLEEEPVLVNIPSTCIAAEDLEKPEYILCAAIHYQDGQAYMYQPKNIDNGLVICGRRHHNCIAIRTQTHLPRITKHVQGFLTNLDRFVNRSEARKIALISGQVVETINPIDLFSEDLY